MSKQKNINTAIILIISLLFLSYSCNVSSNHNRVKQAIKLTNDNNVFFIIKYVDTLFSDTNEVTISEIKSKIIASVEKKQVSESEKNCWLFDGYRFS